MTRPRGSKLRSSYEELVKADLEARQIAHQYETLKLKYIKETCPHCKETIKYGTYTPDFIIDKTIVECKGRFTATDRKKMIAVKKAHPDKNIYLLFQVDDRIGKSPNKRGTKKEDKVDDKRKRYTQWAEANGFICAVGNNVPEEWIERIA